MFTELKKASIACLIAAMLVFSSCSQYENGAFFQEELPPLIKNLPQDHQEAALRQRILTAVPLGSKVTVLEAFLVQNDFVLEEKRGAGEGTRKEAYYQTMRTVAFFKFWSCPYIYYVNYQYGPDQTVKDIEVTFGGYC